MYKSKLLQTSLIALILAGLSVDPVFATGGCCEITCNSGYVQEAIAATSESECESTPLPTNANGCGFWTFYPGLYPPEGGWGGCKAG